MTRTYKDNISLDKNSLLQFFEERANKYDNNSPYSTILYQDKAPEIALERDKHEEQKIKEILNITKNTNVLDIGCGIGRWGEKLSDCVAQYTGIDFSEKLIQIARTRVTNKNARFFVGSAENISSTEIFDRGPYDLVIMAGIMLYLNDDTLIATLEEVAKQMKVGGTLYIREPLALGEKLTLKDFWSEELNQNYSAIYRTRDMFEEIFQNTLYPAGFQTVYFIPLYDEQLNNRKETSQFFAIVKNEASL